MLKISGHDLSLNGEFLELSIELQYEVGEDEAVGLEYFAKVSSSDGLCFATPVETALLTPNGNETSIFRSFECPPSFQGNKITVYYKAFFPEEGGVVELGTPKKDAVQISGGSEKSTWDAGTVSTVVLREDDGSADITLTLECNDPLQWGWMITPLSGDIRGYEVFEPFRGVPIVTVETNTHNIEHGVQADVAFLRAGPTTEVSVDL